MIGSRIRKLRNRAGFSQEYLADALNISQASLSNLESGKSTPDFNILKSLCEVFDIEINELFDSSSDIIFSRNTIDKNIANVEGNVTYELSDKLIEQYEERIKDFKTQIAELKAELRQLKSKS